MNNFELILKNFQPEAAVSRDRGAAESVARGAESVANGSCKSRAAAPLPSKGEGSVVGSVYPLR